MKSAPDKKLETLPLPAINPRSIGYCTGTGQNGTCLLNFAGYEWWTNYHWSPTDGIWAMNQVFNPNNAWVDDHGMHLQVAHYVNQQGQTVWASAEVALYQELGYGQFEFTVQGLQQWWVSGESNLVFGAFTYQPVKQLSVNETNPHIELDAIEISRWGDPVNNAIGTAQFVVQPWEPGHNKHVIQLNPADDSVTVTMDWVAPNETTQFNEVGSTGTINAWTAGGTGSKDVLPYIPTTNGELFHFNFWQFNGQGPSDNTKHELVITKFKFTPA